MCLQTCSAVLWQIHHLLYSASRTLNISEKVRRKSHFYTVLQIIIFSSIHRTDFYHLFFFFVEDWSSLTLGKQSFEQSAQQHYTQIHWINSDPIKKKSEQRKVSEYFKLLIFWWMRVNLCVPLINADGVRGCDGVEWVAVAAWLAEWASNYGTVRGGLGSHTDSLMLIKTKPFIVHD